MKALSTFTLFMATKMQKDVRSGLTYKTIHP